MATWLSDSDLVDVLAALKEITSPYKLGIQLHLNYAELGTSAQSTIACPISRLLLLQVAQMGQNTSVLHVQQTVHKNAHCMRLYV
jgi:hypothetical protein